MRYLSSLSIILIAVFIHACKPKLTQADKLHIQLNNQSLMVVKDNIERSYSDILNYPFNFNALDEYRLGKFQFVYTQTKLIDSCINEVPIQHIKQIDSLSNYLLDFSNQLKQNSIAELNNTEAKLNRELYLNDLNNDFEVKMTHFKKLFKKQHPDVFQSEISLTLELYKLDLISFVQSMLPATSCGYGDDFDYYVYTEGYIFKPNQDSRIILGKTSHFDDIELSFYVNDNLIEKLKKNYAEYIFKTPSKPGKYEFKVRIVTKNLLFENESNTIEKTIHYEVIN